MSKPLSERLSAELVSANKQGDTDLAALLREAAALARRVEDSASGSIKLDYLGHDAAVGIVRAEYDSDEDSEEYHRWVEIEDGKRVRLVPEVDDGRG